MRLPNADRAVIDPTKLHGYLLSRTHPVGRFKAVFFSALGYSSDSWQRLEADLRNQHLRHDAVAGKATRYGQTYEIRATLVGPSGSSARVVSIWFLPADEDVPRFVTAYPEVSR
ncbi:MAG: hypothetical protein HY682_08120 [Chloroflexi bacterium]|nr:hypothetical protein [Chloroflexota bacterium]